jgi:hypothetical protein
MRIAMPSFPTALFVGAAGKAMWFKRHDDGQLCFGRHTGSESVATLIGS